MDHSETRVAVISIIVENMDATERLNSLLHEYAQYVIGRMGIPYREKGINVICVAVDAPQDVISTMAGRIGAIPEIKVKTSMAAR